MARTKQQVRNFRASMAVGILGGLFIFCMFHLLVSSGGMNDGRPDHGLLAAVDLVLACIYCWGYAYMLIRLMPALVVGSNKPMPHWLVIVCSVSLAIGGLFASLLTSLYGWYHGFLDGLIAVGIVFGLGLAIVLAVTVGRYCGPFFATVAHGIWWNVQGTSLPRYLQAAKTPLRKLKSFIEADDKPDDGSTTPSY